MRSKLWSIRLDRCQLGWACTLDFTYVSAAQFTDPTASVLVGGRWRWLAYWRAWRRMRAFVAQHGARPGERERLGWAA